MPPDRDDPVTREERLAELLEEFRASQSSTRTAARDLAADIRARGESRRTRGTRFQENAPQVGVPRRMTREIADVSDRLERLTALAKQIETDCTDSVQARQTLEAVLGEIDTLREKLKVLNLP
jgi:hypothetical protein